MTADDALGPSRRPPWADDGEAPGATAIDADEAAELIPSSVRTMAQLNAFEQANIVAATEWALRPSRRRPPDRVLTIEFLLELHRRMSDRTWRWAGVLRRTRKNLGVHWHPIRVALHERLGDVRAWRAAGLMGADEVAARFHLAIVRVHPFPNGNGRWSRLATDSLLHAQQLRPFSWGALSTAAPGRIRATYLDAIRAADRGDVTPLLAFVRS
jgi:Fic-DOC domain mobile mystery protein B